MVLSFKCLRQAVLLAVSITLKGRCLHLGNVSSTSSEDVGTGHHETSISQASEASQEEGNKAGAV